MNNPDDMPLDVLELREWANAHREANGYSWQEFAKLTGIKAGTLQPWCKNNYAATGEVQAKAIFRYRQTVVARNDRTTGMPKEPGYFETPTSRRIEEALIEAHMGDISVVATAPGTSKSTVAKQYAASNSNVWMATMRESTRSLNQMIWEVAKALGQPLKYQHSPGASRLIADMVRGRDGLIVIDEAGFLELRAFEELRAWHDETGVGICLLGNEELLTQIEGGRRRDQLARLNSRIGNRMIQQFVLPEDVACFCDAWGIADKAMREFLTRIATTPGSGGLRDCRKLVKKGRLLALVDDTDLTLAHLRDADAARATRRLRAS